MDNTKTNTCAENKNNRADILRTLKLKAETKPTFDLAEVNQ